MVKLDITMVYETIVPDSSSGWGTFIGHVKRNCMTAPEYGSGLERVAGWNPAVVTNFIYNCSVQYNCKCISINVEEIGHGSL